MRGLGDGAFWSRIIVDRIERDLMTLTEPEAISAEAERLGKKYVWTLALALGTSVVLQIRFRALIYTYTGYLDETTHLSVFPLPVPEILVFLFMPIWAPLAYWAFLLLFTRQVRRLYPQTLFPQTSFALAVSIFIFLSPFIFMLSGKNSAPFAFVIAVHAAPLLIFLYAYFIFHAFKRQIASIAR
jgi:hypothetical protein